MDWLAIAALEPEPRRAKVAERLAARRLTEVERIADEYTELLALPIFQIAADRVLDHLERAGRPARAIDALSACFHVLEEVRGDASPLFVEPILSVIIELAGASGRASRLVGSDPSLAIELATSEPLDVALTNEDYRLQFEKIVARSPGDTDAFDRRLRRYRNRQMLRIALREIRGEDVRKTAAELAALADEALQACLDHHSAILEKEFGTPDPPCRRLIIGMGKLGGQELNFSSDIDLIYLYEHDDGGAGDLSQHEWHVKLFGRVSSSMSKMTEHGFVFRVDLDLRPEGRTGPLANSLVGAERYYETWGRTWERAAWIKARPVAGDLSLAEPLGWFIRPFVFRRSIDFEAIDEIIDMKARIDAKQRRRLGANGFDLKLGTGGIREIEFYVQAYQLLHGGKQYSLRDSNTMDALLALESGGFVTQRARAALGDAYVLFRQVEHRVQIVEEQQTHSLPTNEDDLLALARSLGDDDPAALHARIEAHRAGVHRLFQGLLGATRNAEPVPAVVITVLDDQEPDQARVDAFAEAGAMDPHAALAHLQNAGRFSKSPFHPRAEGRWRRAAQMLLHDCLESPSVDRALRHLPDLMRAMTYGSSLESLERARLRRGVARLLGASDLLARILISTPDLLIEVLRPDHLPPSEEVVANVEAIAQEMREGPEHALIALRIEKQKETIRTAVGELAEEIDSVAAEERLTTLADAVIGAALALAHDDQAQRYGTPTDPDAALVLLGGGTLGARELSYRTDVDLSAIYYGSGETSGGTRDPITCAEFFARVVQKLRSFLTIRLPQGDLYPVDMRLRPSGQQGTLVTSLDKFVTYQQNRASLWERQALVRTRSIAGRASLREKVDAALVAATYEAGPVVGAKEAIHAMRMKIRSERAGRRRKGEHIIDLKLGRGGLVEVEFIVQFLLISHGWSEPELRTTSTRLALARLGEAGYLDPEEAIGLIDAFTRLRKLQGWLRLAFDEMLDHLDLQAPEFVERARAVGHLGPDAAERLRADVSGDRALIHRIYARVFGLRSV